MHENKEFTFMKIFVGIKINSWEQITAYWFGKPKTKFIGNVLVCFNISLNVTEKLALL